MTKIVKSFSVKTASPKWAKGKTVHYFEFADQDGAPIRFPGTYVNIDIVAQILDLADELRAAIAAVDDDDEDEELAPASVDMAAISAMVAQLVAAQLGSAKTPTKTPPTKTPAKTASPLATAIRAKAKR